MEVKEEERLLEEMAMLDFACNVPRWLCKLKANGGNLKTPRIFRTWKWRFYWHFQDVGRSSCIWFLGWLSCSCWIFLLPLLQIWEEQEKGWFWLLFFFREAMVMEAKHSFSYTLLLSAKPNPKPLFHCFGNRLIHATPSLCSHHHELHRGTFVFEFLGL